MNIYWTFFCYYVRKVLVFLCCFWNPSQFQISLLTLVELFSFFLSVSHWHQWKSSPGKGTFLIYVKLMFYWPRGLMGPDFIKQWRKSDKLGLDYFDTVCRVIFSTMLSSPFYTCCKQFRPFFYSPRHSSVWREITYETLEFAQS